MDQLSGLENPWVDLPKEFPFLLPSDYRAITAFNSGVGINHKIHYELLPEPYLGKPDSPILLLNLNPGYSEKDFAFYEKDVVLKLWKANIFHEPLDYPFFMLDPALINESGPRWWQQKLREVIALAGLKKTANNICCIEYFPYHSKNFQPNKTILKSQEYSFALVRSAIDRGSLIIIMRGEKLWLDAIPDLSFYSSIYRLNSSQNVSISRNNCPEGFQAIKAILSSDNSAGIIHEA